ncbi:hypothetical protein FCM35_KLT01026 [Carex littledalei]|uniref:Uncharacterized protein n=1 Tax=Carex littledalei TaxID=544730 RepID=A0A833QT96_9POAL|nr:hypothetical protein FCM35_KLT01026 [Carex littledalei]
MKVVSLFFKLGGVFIPFSFSSAFIFQFFSLVVIEGMKGELDVLEDERIQPFLDWCYLMKKYMFSLVMFFFPQIEENGQEKSTAVQLHKVAGLVVHDKVFLCK